MSGVNQLRNIGPKSAQMLTEVGITSIDQLREIGAVTAFRRLTFTFGRQVTLNILWAMQAGLRDIDWREVTSAEKIALQAALHDPL